MTTNDTDIIRRAVELAIGWEYCPDDIEGEWYFVGPPPFAFWHPDDCSDVELQVYLAALAAQLRRQVNAMDEYAIHIEPHMVIICDVSERNGAHSVRTKHVSDGGDEAEDTLRAIVESKVLE